MQRARAIAALAALLGAAGAGCTGTIGDGANGGDDEVGCTQAKVETSPVRRLTRWEYDNSVFDLLADDTHPASNFLPESLQLGFTNGAASTPMSATVVEDYENAARAIAARAVTDLPKLMGCDPAAAAGQDACAADFFTRFGRRAFRRPMTSDELTDLTAFYQSQKTEFGFEKSIEMVVGVFLQSPSFLYRVELGMPDPAAPHALRLTGFETATRLSYLMWGTAPDDALLDAAESGELDSPDSVRAWAETMIDDDRGARAISDFYVQWGRLGDLGTLNKDAPAFTPDIAAAMLTETQTFVDDVVRHGDGTMATLLTKPSSFMNADLAAYYGVSGPTGDAFEPVALDPTRYAGLLTQGAFMSTLAHETLPSEVYRGKFVLEQLLCSPPPPPPDNVNTQLPSPDPTKTQREQLEELTSVEPCNSCHSALNPPGFAFEHFDAVGRWRDTDQGHPLDASGDLLGPDDATGHFEDATQLAGILASSQAVRDCAVQEWFHYAYGRAQGENDTCSETQLQTAFGASGGNIRTLLLELTQTPAFLYRTIPAEEDAAGGAP